MRRAVFLDRDDTLIDNAGVTSGTDHPGDLFDPELVRLLPGVAEGLAMLGLAGFALVVYTNQGSVSRGRCTVAEVEATNERVRQVVQAESGVELAGVYYCPYHPRGTVPPWNVEHPWRKPQPGMLLAAATDLGLDLPSSWAIGDAPRDVEAAVAAGIPPARALRVGPEERFLSVREAAAHILAVESGVEAADDRARRGRATGGRA